MRLQQAVVTVLAVAWLGGCPTPRMPCNQDADCDQTRHVCDVSQPLGGAAGTCVGRWMQRTAPGTATSGGSSTAAATSARSSSSTPSSSVGTSSVASTSVGSTSVGSSSVGSSSAGSTSAGSTSAGSTSVDSSSGATSAGSSGSGGSSGAVCPGCVWGDGGCAQTVDLTACGAGGGSCLDCTTVGDACLGDGGCGCGTGPACATGFVCLQGSCTCDARTCPTGCCNANGCQPGDRKPACGGAGLTCDNCTGPNQCVGHICPNVCTAANCATGCCSGSTCVTAPGVNACGTAGLLCLACDTNVADGCTAGACTCGGAAACVAPEVCRNGSCGPA